MSAQTVLTAALEVSVIASIAYIALALACFISRIDTSAAAPADESHPESHPESQPVPAQPKTIKPVAIDAKVEPQPAPNYQGMKVAELRAIAQSLGLPTRAADADRRLNKTELVEAIAAVSS